MKHLPVKYNQDFELGTYWKFASRETATSRDEIIWAWFMHRKGFQVIHVPRGHLIEYWVHDKGKKILQDMANYLINNWDEHINKYDKICKNMIELAKQLSSTTDHKQLLKLYKEYVDVTYDFSEYMFAPWAVAHYIEPYVVQKYPEKFGLITSLEKPYFFMELQKDLFELSTKEMLKKWSWIKVYSVYDIPPDEKYFEKLKSDTSKEDVDKLFESLEVNRKEYHDSFGKLNDKKIDIVHNYAFLKTHRIDLWKKTMFYLTPFYKYLAKLGGYPIRGAANLTIQEIFEILEHNKFPEKQLIESRNSNSTVYFYEQDYLNVINNDKVKELQTYFANLEKNTEIKGLVTCKGKVQGPVKIIKSSKDLHKVEKGDIFVAIYTFPDFTPKMSISAAIVTDEGGITSHAAIISREYNIPGIIGTRIATTTLKDGDIVEVDAEKGIVKIIERK